MKEDELINHLYNITNALYSTLDPKKSLWEVLRYIAENLGMERGSITILDRDTKDIHIEVAYGLTPEQMERGRYSLGEGVTGKVVATGTPIIIRNVAQDPLFLDKTQARQDLDKERLSYICVPIKDDHGILGTIGVDMVSTQDMDLDRWERFLNIIAGLMAQKIKVLEEIHQDQKRLRDENRLLKKELGRKYRFQNLIGESKKMQEVFYLVSQVAESNATVLILGESGTGKELVANAIHYNSPRKNGPFVKLNCAALPHNLVEAELFGYEKGAFTGAIRQRQGKFEVANGGSLFLDEIGSLPLESQGKLLRVLQERELERLGGNKIIKVNVRLIAASNRDLSRLVEEGKFREDLYYRLNVFPIYLPPLRERESDILLLANYFVEKFSKEYNKEVKRISTPAIDALMRYHWPGNVRELENVMERAVLLCEDMVIHSYHLPPTLQTAQATGTEQTRSFKDAVAQYEKELLVEALKLSGGNVRKAAKAIATTERIFMYKAKKYGIDPRAYK